MITVTGEATFDDYRPAQRNNTWKQELLIACVLLSAGAFVAYLEKHYIIFLIIVIVYLLGARPLYWQFRLKRNWNKISSTYSGQRRYGFDEAGFHMTDDVGKSTVSPWDQFLKFRESKDTFFLHVNPSWYIFLPKRLINESDQDKIRELLQSRIGQKSGRISK